MKILYVASEALPFAASGGLGDVMGSLPSAVSSCLGEGSDVRVIMPMYKSVRINSAHHSFSSVKYTFRSRGADSSAEYGAPSGMG